MRDDFRALNRSDQKLRDAKKNYYNEKRGGECRTYSATHPAYCGTVLQAQKGGKK